MHEVKKEDLDLFYIDRKDYDRVDQAWNSAYFNLKWWKVAYLAIFDKRFRWFLKDTLLYAIRWENTVRGNNSSDVFLFMSYYSSKIFEVKKDID